MDLVGNQLVVYEDGELKLDVNLAPEMGAVWLDRSQLSMLFVLIRIALFPIPEGSIGEEQLKSVKELLQSELPCGRRSYCISDRADEVQVLCECHDDARTLEGILVQVQTALCLQFAVDAIFGVSRCTTSLLQLPDVYEQAGRAMGRSFVEEADRIFFDEGEVDEPGNREAERKVEGFIDEICRKGEITNREALENLYAKTRSAGPIDETLLKGMYKFMLNRILLNSLERNTYRQIHDRYLAALDRVDRSRKLSELHSEFVDFSNFVNLTEKSNQSGSSGRIIDEVKEFIDLNYSQDIYMNDISALLKRSPNYLSSLFRKMSGESFSEYLTRKRIEKAKSMLALTDATLFCIARDIGFHDERYFIKLFKKSEGMTPSQYRHAAKRIELQEGISS